MSATATDRAARIEEITINILQEVPQAVLERAVTSLPTDRLNALLGTLKKEAGARSKPADRNTKVPRESLYPFDVRGKVPFEILQQAMTVHDRWSRGKIHVRRFHANRDIIVLEVGLRYRMVANEREMNWVLMSHETYNRVVKTRQV